MSEDNSERPVRSRATGLNGFGKSFTQLPTPMDVKAPAPPPSAIKNRMQTVPAPRAEDIAWGRRLARLSAEGPAALLRTPVSAVAVVAAPKAPTVVKMVVDCQFDGEGLRVMEWVDYDAVGSVAAPAAPSGGPLPPPPSQQDDTPTASALTTDWKKELGPEDAKGLEDLLTLWTEKHQKK